MLVKVEDLLLAGPSLLRQVTRDLAWPTETLARETMVRLMRSNFQQNSDEGHELRRLMLRVFLGSSSTKEVLESTFGHMRDISARHAKNMKMCTSSIWFYSAASPYAQETHIFSATVCFQVVYLSFCMLETKHSTVSPTL